MLGFNRLRRRYKRFRYNNQARFPRLFVILEMAEFPLQLLAVALPLWLVVSFYDDHFSYRAKNAQRAPVSAVDTTPRQTAEPIEVDNSLVAIDRGAEQPVEEALTESADTLVAVKSPSVTPVVVPGNETETQPLAEPDKLAELSSVVERISGPAQIHIDRLTSKPEPIERSGPVLRDAGWLKDQAESSFVIQLESSVNVDRMRQQINRLSTAEQLAIYPYKVSVNGDVVYGLSYGLYDTLSQAKQANSEMPAELRRFGSWIRQVGPLKQQIEQIDGPVAQRE